jgi:hypothetical protein
MTALNFPEYTFKIRQRKDTREIFDVLRKKYVALTPEEWVRQHAINFLIYEKKFPAVLLASEVELNVIRTKKRCDILAYERSGQPFLIVECKAPEVKITQEVFEQIARYNIPLKVKYLMVTNGLIHYFCKINYTNGTFSFLKDIPDFSREDK